MAFVDEDTRDRIAQVAVVFDERVIPSLSLSLSLVGNECEERAGKYSGSARSGMKRAFCLRERKGLPCC